MALRVAILMLFLTASSASAQEWAAAEADSRSNGRADEGTLENAFTLGSDDELRVVRQHRYGTREMVGLLHRSADRIAQEFPGSQLSVGDLSSESGGHLTPHVSHQSGRDADVGFYVRDENGRPIQQAMFVRMGEDGFGRRNGVRYEFDDQRNWALMVAWVDDLMAEVQHVLISAPLRERLMNYGRDNGASEDFLDKVRRVTHPIRGSENHDDHFHLRIYCSVGDRPACIDLPPLHPWYDGTPSPRAVAAARIADDRRAAAERREAERSARAEAELRTQEERQADLERERARVLESESTRQSRAEERRAADLRRQQRRQRTALGQHEVRLIREMRQRESVERRRARLSEREEQRRLAQLTRESERGLRELQEAQDGSTPNPDAAVANQERAAELVERRRRTALQRQQARERTRERRRQAAEARDERLRAQALAREQRRQESEERRRAIALSRERARAEREQSRDVAP